MQQSPAPGMNMNSGGGSGPMMQPQQPQQQQSSTVAGSGNPRPMTVANPNSPMFVSQQQQMQRNMQNSPMHSGHTTPSPIRSPYHPATTPSPQHPGFGTPGAAGGPMSQQQPPVPQQQQAGMMGNFNRFQQPGMMSAGNVQAGQGGFPAGNNYGYMPNYRMQQNSMQQQYNMQGGNGNPVDGYNNHFMGGNNFPNAAAGMQRFGGPGPVPGQFFPGNQMQGQQQQGFNTGFNNTGNAFGGPAGVTGNPGSGPTGNNPPADGFHHSQQQQHPSGGPPGSEFYGANGGNPMGGYMPNNRMMNAEGGNGQPIPPHFRGNMMQQSPNHHPMGSPVGPPRISPSAMHKPMPGVGMPMPGVGMPRASPSIGGPNGMPPRQQPTPLVSPQSMHSDVQSPGSMHNPMTPVSNATTPAGLQHGGMTSPMYNNMPKTPQQLPQHQQHSMMSPSPRGGPSSVPPAQSPMTEDLKSPMPAATTNQSAALKSPLPYTGYTGNASNLRKIRRPSKPSTVSGGEVSPLPPSSNDPPPAAPAVAAATVKAEPVVDVKPPAPPPAPPVASPVPSPKKEEPEEPQFQARWEELDSKVWKRIFGFCSYNDGSVPFLVRAQRVCKKWKDVATSDPMLWTHLDLSQGRGFKERYRNDKKLEWFLKKYGNVQELILGGWKNSVVTSTLKIISQYCPNLLSLGLSGCFKLTNEDLKLVGDSFPKLERIDLSGVSPSSSSSRSAVSSTCLTDFITVLGNRLTMLNISNNKMAGLPFVFKALSTHSVNLEELDISNITTTSRDTININLEKFQKGCQKLRILNANHTMLSLTDTPVREQVNSPGFPNLKELHIAVDSRGYFDGMDDSQIERVLGKSASLRVLDLRGCQHVSNSCLVRLKSWDIEKLILAGCSATSDSCESIELLVKKLANLSELDIGLTTGERTINNAVNELAEVETHVLR